MNQSQPQIQQQEFLKIVKQIENALGINNNELVKTVQQLKLDFSKVNMKEQNVLNSTIGNLIKADQELKNLEMNSEFNMYIQNNIAQWKDLKKNIGKLQALTLINKISKERDCNNVIKTMIKVMNDKIKLINELKESEYPKQQSAQQTTQQTTQQQMGGERDYKQKYMKYKKKYMMLKEKKNKK